MKHEEEKKKICERCKFFCVDVSVCERKVIFLFKLVYFAWNGLIYLFFTLFLRQSCCSHRLRMDLRQIELFILLAPLQFEYSLSTSNQLVFIIFIVIIITILIGNLKEKGLIGWTVSELSQSKPYEQPKEFFWKFIYYHYHCSDFDVIGVVAEQCWSNKSKGI